MMGLQIAAAALRILMISISIPLEKTRVMPLIMIVMAALMRMRNGMMLRPVPLRFAEQIWMGVLLPVLDLTIILCLIITSTPAARAVLIAGVIGHCPGILLLTLIMMGMLGWMTYLHLLLSLREHAVRISPSAIMELKK